MRKGQKWKAEVYRLTNTEFLVVPSERSGAAASDMAISGLT